MSSEARRLTVIAAVAAAMLIAAMALAAWSFHNERAEQCRTRDVTLDILRDILQEARAEVATNLAYSAERRERSLRFYDNYLQRVKTARC